MCPIQKHKPLLLTIVGPTASGKTSLAVALAKKLQTEIISCDSRQFYQEMMIGTAVPTVEEQQEIPHHFIQHISIHQPYSVGDFERDVLNLLDEKFKTYPILIMVGGSGLFESAVNEGLNEFPELDESIRENLNNEWENNSEELLDELKTKDFETYQSIDLQNPRRVIRALEIIRQTGKKFSDYKQQPAIERPFHSLKFKLEMPREILYERINQRVDEMMDQGLLDEVESLLPYKELKALKTVGYQEFFSYFEGIFDLETAIEEVKKNTRRYAKRQLTWYRSKADVIPVSSENAEKIILQEVQSFLAGNSSKK